MLVVNEVLQTLKSYNLFSQKFEPTIYENKNDLGICLDVKDSIFGYLTRIFTFNQKQELDDFLTAFFWYKKNHQKYQIKLTLDSYSTKNPHIIYKYKEEPITLENMLNIENFLQKETKENEEEQEKKYFLTCINELTNYLINLKQQKENIKLEKNKLKAAENDLKFELLTKLTIYYGKENKQTKKEITFDTPSIIDNTQILANAKNIQDKTINEVKDYLSSLINIIKAEELDEKNLVNIYSNNVYNYNIDILKKQIDFVKTKINAEKNFNLKGSKIHNIDEELKSFLKTNIAPTKIEIFLNDNKTQIEEKFNKITDLKNACKIITGKTISIPEEKNNVLSNTNGTSNLLDQFNELPKKTQNSLILYNSIYKTICNFIINNHYPEINIIKKHFDFNHYYQELEEIVMNENNNHYLTNYFSEVNFKDLNNYINSIINICKDVENTIFKNNQMITLFATEQTNKYKQLTELPSKNTKYLITTNNDLLLIPYQLEMDWDSLEINLIENNNYYTKDTIVEEIETIKLIKYRKKNIKKDGIIITTDLIANEEIILNKSHLEGEIYG